MRGLRAAAVIVLVATGLFSLFVPAIRGYGYDEQFRDHIGERPSRQFPLGTDDLGRDRAVRLWCATRVSAGLACAAAAISILLGLIIAVFTLSFLRKPIAAATTLCLSLPWMFVFIILRGLLPLNTSPAVSIGLTFGVMGLSGWAVPARVFSAFLSQCSNSEWMTHARATGMKTARIWRVHLWPHVRSIAWAQFRALVPAYILAEAGLGLLGLGVAEPATSLGSLIAELQRAGSIEASPWLLAPLGVLATITISLELLRRGEERGA